MLDMAVLADEIATIVTEEIERSTAPLLAENRALQARIKDLEDSRPLRGIDGQDGRDGADVDMGEVAERIDAAVKAAVAALPSPAPGEPGKDGRDGTDGQDGKDGLNGADGKDGAGIADLVIDRDDNLVATFTDGRMKSLGVVVGKNGDKGEDGKNGLQLEDFEAKVLDDGRTIRFAMTAGDIQYAYQLSFPVVIDRGVWREGQEYKTGDGVTWAGSYWIAQKDTMAKPDSGDGFRLAVKRGRDGKSAEPLKAAQ